jgi:hypothetical protein
LCATPTVEQLEQLGDVYEVWNMYITDERPTGVAATDLTLRLHLKGPELDRKVTALRAMATQTAGLIATLDVESYSLRIADESFLKAPAGVGHARAAIGMARSAR